MKSASQMKLNPPTAAAISSEQSEDFTLRSNISPTRKGGFSWKRKDKSFDLSFFFWRYRPDLNWRMRVLQTLALPLGHGTIWSGWRGSNSLPPPWQGGALPDELHPQIWCLRSELNQRHADFQSAALPTELQRHVEQIWLCSKHADAYLFGDPERTRTVDLQRDRLAC